MIMNLYDNNTEFKKNFNSIINNYFCYLKKMENLINLEIIIFIIIII